MKLVGFAVLLLVLLCLTVMPGKVRAGPVDTEPPSKPSGLVATVVNSNQINLQWNASTDNIGVAGYEIFRNGTRIATLGAVTSYSDTTVSPATTYTYTVVALDTAGNHSPPSDSATKTTPAPSLTISTRPPTPNLQVSFDGTINETGSDGNFTVSRPVGNYTLQAFQETPLNESSKAIFDRWGDLTGRPESFQPTRTIELTSDQRVLLLIRLVYRVSMNFSDPGGRIVDGGLVENVQLQSSSGQSYLFTSYKNLWFEANRFQQLAPPAYWKVITNTYTVASVNVTGRNVVQRGLFVFTPRPDDEWRVSLLLYSLTVTVSDMLFGTPLGATVRISDLSTGQEVTTQRTSRGQAFWDLFPRGDYVIRVSGPGLALQVPVIFTEPTSQNIRVLSYIDLGFLIAIFALGLMIFRWRHSILYRWRKKRETVLSCL